MSRSLPPCALLEQNLALGRYLEALLSDKPMHLPVPIAPAPKVVVAEVLTRSVEPLAVATPAAAGVPSWGVAPFQSLMLRVQGLSLALPLVKLNRILPWTEPTRVPGYVPWFLGLVRYLDRNVRVVDTAALLMPQRMSQRPSAGQTTHWPGRSDAQPRRPMTVAVPNRQTGSEGTTPTDPAGRHIVLIGDGRWGLVCDAVFSVITLDPARVRWRSTRSKRPWLAGTAVEYLCAVLDAERLAELLDADCPESPP